MLITADATVQTSRQIKRELLCGACEDRFSRQGENIVLQECCRSSTEFLLRDKLRSETPVADDGDWACYAGSRLANVNIEAYRYFAASVVWRASVARWPGDFGKKYKPHSLGRKYEESFRQYLLGNAAFPPEVRMFMFVADGTGPQDYFCLPVSDRDGTSHIHWFRVQGIEFRLFVSSLMDTDVANLFAVFQNENVLLTLSDQRESPSLRKIAEVVRDSPKRGRLAR